MAMMNHEPLIKLLGQALRAQGGCLGTKSLALRAEERRDKLRKAAGRSKYP